MKKIFVFPVLLFFSALFAQDPRLQITPKPFEEIINTSSEGFTIYKNTTIYIYSGPTSKENKKLRNIAEYLNDYLKTKHSFSLNVNALSPLSNYIPVLNFIELRLDRSFGNKMGAYSLKVSNESISVNASSDAGIFYGVQSLIQLIGSTEKKQTQL